MFKKFVFSILPTSCCSMILLADGRPGTGFYSPGGDGGNSSNHAKGGNGGNGGSGFYSPGDNSGNAKYQQLRD